MADEHVGVPDALAHGVPMLKISSKKIKQVIMRLEDGAITWAGAKSTRVPISQIRELRMGQPPTETYNSTRWITIVYVRGSQMKVLHMIALTDDVFDLWVTTLRTLVSETSDRLVNEVKPADPDLLWIRQLWPAGVKAIDQPTATALLRQVGLVVPESWKAAPRSMLDMSDFRQLVKDAQSRPEIEELFSRLAPQGVLGRAQVEGFLRDVQRVEPGDLFDKYARKKEWTVDSLAEFLSSPDNSPKRQQDLTHSIVDYFISSSHNTYLVGEQWRGESTVEGYIRVLLAGCRCVEIDVHNGELEPVVYHKKTLTSRAPVRDICRAINKYAFVHSPYPVIISAEIHCDAEQQSRLASIMLEVFGNKLITTPIHTAFDLPSPEDLKGRILFKAKPRVEDSPEPSPPSSAVFDSTESTNESDSGFARLARRLSISSPSLSPDKPTFSSTLADLLVYTHGVKYQGFSKLNNYLPRHQFSVAETTANRIIRENKADWIKHNFTHISRVYPKAIRMLSTNFDPTPYWSAGCQLVAMNWQTIDPGSVLNQAMFADTPGYVLKPLALRQKVGEVPRTWRLRVQILSAQRLPLASSSDLSVEATLGASSTKKTSVVKGMTLNPRWNDSLEWTMHCTPSQFDLTFLHLEVKSRGALLAQWVRPLPAAPKGYHHLPLYDHLCARFVFASLFVRIEIDEVGAVVDGDGS